MMLGGGLVAAARRGGWGCGGRRSGCRRGCSCGGLASSACASASLSDWTWRVGYIRGYVLRGLGFDARLLEEAEVSGPVDEAILPGSEGDVVAVGQATGHAASVRQGVAGVAAVAV